MNLTPLSTRFMPSSRCDLEQVFGRRARAGKQMGASCPADHLQIQYSTCSAPELFAKRSSSPIVTGSLARVDRQTDDRKSSFSFRTRLHVKVGEGERALRWTSERVLQNQLGICEEPHEPSPTSANSKSQRRNKPRASKTDAQLGSNGSRNSRRTIERSGHAVIRSVDYYPVDLFMVHACEAGGDTNWGCHIVAANAIETLTTLRPSLSLYGAQLGRRDQRASAEQHTRPKSITTQVRLSCDLKV